MKPKTTLQKQIMKLSKRLIPMTEKQRQWAYKNSLKHYGYRLKSGTVSCMDCGYTWEVEDGTGQTVCPRCGEKLTIEDTKKRTLNQVEYMCIVTTCKGFQVVRFFYVKSLAKKGNQAERWVQEVVQRWITPEGKSETVALLRGLSWFCDQWLWKSDLEIRPKHEVYNINPTAIYPYKRILPIIKRNGFDGDFHGANPTKLLQMLLTDNKVETLIKAGEYELLSYYVEAPYSIGKNWNSIKICLRNKYKIEDIPMWCDYIDLLKKFHKDTQNAKYVCPTDLEAEHDRLVKRRTQQWEKERKEWERRREIERQEAKRKQLERMQEHERLYAEMKSKFFDLVFSDGALHVQVLQSVQEFYEEGKALHHCVFTNEYYLKPYSLILSARIGTERIETIEVSLDTLQIIQSRGIYNRDTEYHQHIIRLVNKNKRFIRKRLGA